MSDGSDVARALGDVTSVGILLGTLAQALPAIAALLTIVWTSIRIYESRTVQLWLRKEDQP